LLLGPVLHLLQALFPNHVDRDVHQIANHRFHIAAYVAHFRELASFHLEERRVGQLRQPARNLSLADTGRPDHQDIFGHHLFGHLGFQLLPANPVAKRDGDGTFRIRLPNHMLV